MKRSILSGAVLVFAALLAGCGEGEIGLDGTADPGLTGGTGAGAAGAAGNDDFAIHSKAIATPAQSQWGPLINLPLVPSSAANLPNGKILLWAAESRFGFSSGSQTYSALYDPVLGSVTERLVSETGHDMFCTGTTNLADGRLLINGGLSAAKTSHYDAASNSWSTGALMNIARGYQANTILSDGRVFTLGGSWSGGVGNKHGEVWSPSGASGSWSRLSGVPIDSFLSVETSRPTFGPDSHFWLLPAGNGRVLYAGPGVNMQWIDPTGNGSVSLIGPRGDDEFSINGNTVMYEQGRILKTGGARNYTDTDAQSNANSFIIDVTGRPVARRIGSMAFPRSYHNSVVLPNGQVVIIGGQTYARGFSDSNSVMVPELFDPRTETFTQLPAMAAPRNYHSVALLLPDGRVLSGGGGLCGTGCAANHPDIQILTPNYLLNPNGTPATRPVINTAPATSGYGVDQVVTTNGPVASFALIRLSSTTHAVNNDQRRIALAFTQTGTNTYRLAMPSNPGWALPGYYWLFAMNADGTPSLAKTLRLGNETAPRLPVIADQGLAVGAPYAFTVAGSHPNNAALTYSAQNLPAGLAINPTTGAITGTPTAGGSSTVTVNASDGQQTISTQAQFVVTDPGNVRFVRLEALSEAAGNPWASIAELNLFDERGQTLGRGTWTATASSAESGNAATAAIDGNTATFWHTRYSGTVAQPPHWFQIALGGAYRLGGLRVLPRQDASNNGTIAQFRVLVSTDGVNWSLPVAEGSLTPLGGAKQERVVYFINSARGKVAQQSSTANGGAAARAVDGNTNGVFAQNSVTHTAGSAANDWWEVDLGASYTVLAARLWNRTDCCAERLANLQVFVSDAPMVGRTYAQLLADPLVRRAALPGTAAQTALLQLNASGRHVRVQLAGTGVLSLAEVEVFTSPFVNRAPTITTPAPRSQDVGTAASLQIAAADPDGDPLTYSASGLPGGLAINAATGLISGTAANAGVFTPTITVSDGRGGSASATFGWTVAAVPPVVNPVPVTVATVGGSISYSASATGNGALAYQWNFGDGTVPGGFVGSPNASHVYAASGVYTVTLAVRDGDGAVSYYSFLQAVAAPPVAGTPMASSNLILEPRSGASARIWTVNPDTDTVSVIDAVSHARVAEIAVGRAPRTLARGTDGRIWVTNKDSATLSVINPATLAVAQTVALPRASQPYGIVFGTNGQAYVTLEATGQLARLNADGSGLALLALGGTARHLARNAAGNRLLVSRFITAPQPGEATATVQTTAGGVPQGATVGVVNPATLTLIGSVTLRHSDKSDSTAQGRGVPNYLGAPAFSPDGASAWVPAKQDNIARGALRDGLDLDFQNTVRAISSRIDTASLAEDYDARVDHDNSGLASAAAYHPSGAYLFVALETSRQVAVVDPGTRRELFRGEAGLAPQAVAVAADGKRLYAHNFMSRSVTVFDLEPLLGFGRMELPVLATVATIGAEKLTANVLRGKQIFYDARDPRIARDAYISCASCHNDGGHDGRTWDFTGFGEGLRNTIPLTGRGVGHGRSHWSGNFDEIQDFEGQIRGLNQGTGLMSDAQFLTGTRSQPLGDRKAGVSADLDALAAYVMSLTTSAPSPFRQANGEPTAAAQAGQTVFDAKCANCHGGEAYTNSESNALANIGTIKPASGKRLGAPLTGLDVPTLRDVWSTAPYLHDGSAATIGLAISAHTNVSLTTTELANVTAFIQQIGDASCNQLPNPSFEQGTRGWAGFAATTL
ncbi:MAG: discoidin domain-containing protein, partial [Lautropia sp.]